jgi:hypothetical protein
MDGDRKYSQRGYQESGSEPRNGNHREDRPKHTGPRPPIDITGPRLPRLVQSVTASRCFNCSSQLPPGIDFRGNCPKCNAQLHCCKQCSHFEPATRFQCVKPIALRIAVKDQANECTMFAPRVTVARDAIAPAPVRPVAAGMNSAPPRNASDARSAFESLFKK